MPRTIPFFCALICLFLPTSIRAAQCIAGHQVATQAVLRSIPRQYIDQARQSLHIAYQHTSHGTHVSYGLFGLPRFRPGDNVLFAISEGGPEPGRLDFHDYALAGYHAPGKDASDLSRDETAFIQATRNFLDDPANADINVVMWSWCSITGHDVSGNYLPGMQTLINEYGPGGSKIGTGPGRRATPVTFIFMTGHAEKNNNTGRGHPRDQAALITDYCRQHHYFCLDYSDIDTHDMVGHYWEDAGDNGDSDAYGGNFYIDWQNSHVEGVDWYPNRTAPGGPISWGAHNSQHITANRKAYAMWWILARIAGWDPDSGAGSGSATTPPAGTGRACAMTGTISLLLGQ
ncbi:hypothetical protein ACLG6S_10135 [Thermodesulfobacteriota bacterium B35]